MNLTNEITELVQGKELNKKALDSVVPSVFKVFEPEAAGEAQMLFDTLLIVLGYELDQEVYLEKIVQNLSGFEIAQLAKSLVTEDIYKHYNEILKLEYSTSAQPLMKAMNKTIDDSQRLVEEFDKANKTLNDNLN